MPIFRGDVYWVLRDALGGVPHPYVIVQDDVFNHSRIETVVACALTTNLHRVSLPGNVLLDAGEANLPRQSVVEVAKVTTLRKVDLGAHIGRLSAQRTGQILAGLRFVQSTYQGGDTA
ncbi:MAG: type II toxin-antitoxin system PemK/MazF family toxin [Anaerolineae bacterium]|jgi:mRNA interferase MazF|nr:type II toxin-antitoxin system PemK/MazF family toxin [Chloroflexota bacterium]MBV6436585.1 Endoribonuclease MazF6 [Anaerolineae bacterium]MCO6443230.1 type II toxin-antitoxin system PemK/MazF family toxin [Anaerolineae bacterium]OQY81601.1 MAG: hypothetical protein B6D42_10890 [Anaerolineae bacterium UTCFX5]